VTSEQIASLVKLVRDTLPAMVDVTPRTPTPRPPTGSTTTSVDGQPAPQSAASSVRNAAGEVQTEPRRTRSNWLAIGGLAVACSFAFGLVVATMRSPSSGSSGSQAPMQPAVSRSQPLDRTALPSGSADAAAPDTTTLAITPLDAAVDTAAHVDPAPTTKTPSHPTKRVAKPNARANVNAVEADGTVLADEPAQPEPSSKPNPKSPAPVQPTVTPK
jgi:hypothetical protein